MSIHPQGRYDISHPSPRTHRCARPRLQPEQYRHLLRRRSGLQRHPRRYADAGTTGTSPSAGAPNNGQLPRLPRGRPSRPLARPEREWGDRTGRMDQGVPVL